MFELVAIVCARSEISFFISADAASIRLVARANRSLSLSLAFGGQIIDKGGH